MGIELLIATYGYIALFWGAFFEGETVLIFGGILAHEGYLSLFLVILTVFIATILWDQLFFYLGRRYGSKILKFRPKWKPLVRKILTEIERNSKKVIFSYRFIYGTRTIVPFALGISKVPTRRYVLLSIVYAFIWSVCFGILGYFFGYSLEFFLGKIRVHELKAILIIIIIFAIIWPAYKYFIKKVGKLGSAK